MTDKAKKERQNASTKLTPDDVQLLIPVLLLVGIGLAMVFSASCAIGLSNNGTGYYFLQRQLVFSIMGLVALLMCRLIPYRWYWYWVYVILFGSMMLLCAVFIPGIGRTVGGATRWIGLGFFNVQPSELARLAMVIFLAYSLTKKEELIERFSIGVFPHAAVAGVFGVVLLMQPDFGSLAILGTMTWVMLFHGGARIRHLVLPLTLVLPVLFYLMIMEPYRLVRVTSFLNPWAYEANTGYQLVHSQMAFGSGGIWGVGVGKGFQKLFYLPEPHTDFVFSVIGEELGLLRGVLPVLALFGWLVWRGITVSRNAPDRFGSILAMGLTVGIALQATVNFCVTLGLLPTKGLPLPFLSYGGTSLIVSMASIGILMNIGATRAR
jgi:cell division protein FtsW